MDKVKIWGNDLKCQVCNSDKWYSSIMRVELASLNDRQNFNEQVRYLFECGTCGNAMLFGMMNNWEIDEKSIKIIPLDKDCI